METSNSRFFPTLQSEITDVRKDRCYRIFPIMRPSLKTRVQRRLSEIGKSPAKATEDGGLSRTAIYDILDGKTQNVRTDTARKLAKGLECEVSYITGEQNTPAKSKGAGPPTLTRELQFAPLVGNIAAGVWHESDLFGVEPDLPPGFEAQPLVPFVPDPKFKGLKQFAVRVVGPSVNKIIPDGDFAICVPYWEARTAIRDRDLVVVERARAGLFENTIKRVCKAPKGWELRPDSTDPKHQTPLRLTDKLDGERDSPDVTVEIKGLVIWRGGPVG